MIERLGSRDVFVNRWLRLREDDVRFPDGHEDHYTVVERRDFAAVIAVERDGLWLVEQYRYPLGRRMWELPQGAWPPGHDGSALELAQAELREETGLTAATWRHLGRLASGPGLLAQHYDVFLASELTPGAPARERSEADMVHRWFAERDVWQMVAAGQFSDSHSLAALGLYAAAVGRVRRLVTWWLGGSVTP